MLGGNDVRDEVGEAAFFQELSSNTATPEASRYVDAYGLVGGNATEGGDGDQAYTQVPWDQPLTIKTWVRLPKDFSPKGFERFHDPVVPLLRALYGHPDAGSLWEKHCEDATLAAGFQRIAGDAWSSVFWHPKKLLLLVVYVDESF